VVAQVYPSQAIQVHLLAVHLSDQCLLLLLAVAVAVAETVLLLLQALAVVVAVAGILLSLVAPEHLVKDFQADQHQGLFLALACLQELAEAEQEALVVMAIQVVVVQAVPGLRLVLLVYLFFMVAVVVVRLGVSQLDQAARAEVVAAVVATGGQQYALEVHCPVPQIQVVVVVVEVVLADLAL
jgi:hypothetical protein